MNDLLALIDSNILIYSKLQESQFHQKAKNFLENNLKKKNFVLSLQNLTEFYSTITNPRQTVPVRTSQEATLAVKKFLESGFYRLIFPKNGTSDTLLNLLKKYPARGADVYDVCLAAVMMDNDINTIYTADTKIFKRLGLKAINPFQK